MEDDLSVLIGLKAKDYFVDVKIMIYFKSLCILEMWAGISIPVHIFESWAEIVYRGLGKKKGPEGLSNLSTAVRGSALKNLSAACVQSRMGAAGKRWKKREPQKGLLLHGRVNVICCLFVY